MDKKEQDNITSFQSAFSKMSGDNDYLINDEIEATSKRNILGYNEKQLSSVISKGSLEEQRLLSLESFNTDGIYSRIIMYYATLLMYKGILIPHTGINQQLSSPHISKKYYSAQKYADDFFKPEMLIDWTRDILVNGAYYGIIDELTKKELEEKF